MNSELKAKIIAYYLPQFHPIPENDAWWGKGFTEWTNVGKAKPLFRGHYQPRVPADLGYYDLRIPQIREQQAKLAKEAGIEGFMYWHYWFGNGKRILEKPFNDVVESGTPDFPFCLGWANHSWRSDSWKKSQATLTVKTPELLIEQQYPGLEDYIEHFNTLLPAFLDKRYIRVDGKPLFLVYSPLEIPDCKLFLETWNDLAKKNGFDGFHFVGLSKGWSSEVEKILSLGFDAVNRNGQWEAECSLKGKYSRIFKYKMLEKIGGVSLDTYDYGKVVAKLFSKYEELENVYPTVLSQWDRSARSGNRAVIYKNGTPQKFKIHLESALKFLRNKNEQKRIVFLKSWNEWGEGNYVEPDLKYGHQYLDAIKDSLLDK